MQKLRKLFVIVMLITIMLFILWGRHGHPYFAELAISLLILNVIYSCYSNFRLAGHFRRQKRETKPKGI